MRFRAASACAQETGSPLRLDNGLNAISVDENDAEDDEAQMLSALKKVAHKIKTGPTVPQGKTSNKPKPLTSKQIDWVVSQIQTGKLRLPEPDEVDGKDYAMRWALGALHSHREHNAQSCMCPPVLASLAQARPLPSHPRRPPRVREAQRG